MPHPPEDTLDGDDLEKWLKKGPKKLTIDDETDFVDPQILKGIVNSKVSEKWSIILVKINFLNYIILYRYCVL